MHHVHFVGSVALDTPEEVFAAIGQHCGPYLKRVPDGEPGGRRLWISWQIPVLRANPSLAQVGEGQIPLKLADGVEPGRIHFGELGYSREARPSYEDFVAARTAGRLPAGVRFQVSLPTPWAVIMPFCRQPDAQQIYPAYEQAMLREVARICKAIPHHDLAIQWDVCIEMLAWDGRWQNAPPFPGMEQVFAGNFARLGRGRSAWRRAGIPPVLRRSRCPALRRAGRRDQDGGAGQPDRAQRTASHRLGAHAGARRSCRRGFLCAAHGPAARNGHRALSRAGPRLGRCRRHGQAHGCGEEVRLGLRGCHPNAASRGDASPIWRSRSLRRTLPRPRRRRMRS